MKEEINNIDNENEGLLYENKDGRIIYIKEKMEEWMGVEMKKLKKG